MFPQLATERLLLQQILPEDQPFVFEGLSHPGVIRFYGVSYQTCNDTTVQMEWYRMLLADGSGIPWKIVRKEWGDNIGVAAVYGYKPEHRKAELGVWLLPQFWHKGYAREALREVIRFWQHEKHLHRLEAFVEAENPASCKLLERAGFGYEGLMKDCEIKNGRFISLKIYALLACVK